MRYEDNGSVWDTDDWFYCDKDLLDVFGVSYVSKQEFLAVNSLRYGIEFESESGRVTSLTVGSCKRLVLGEIGYKCSPMLLYLPTDFVLVLDERNITRPPRAFCMYDVTAVKDDASLDLIYNFTDRIIDHAARYREQIRRAHIIHGKRDYAVQNFTSSEDDAFVASNFSHFIEAKKRFDKMIIKGQTPTIPTLDDPLAAFEEFSQYPCLGVFKRYMTVGGRHPRVMALVKDILDTCAGAQ